MKNNHKIFKAFSLAEMMVVMFILSIFLAATIPIISKRTETQGSSHAKRAGEALYLYSTTIPTPCPSGWTDAGFGASSASSSGSGGANVYTYTRSCYNSTQNCSTIYLYGANEPEPCPEGWDDAGSGASSVSAHEVGEPISYTYTRSCYKCH